MAISDPALDFIEAQKPELLDFIFRLTGDRSRAGIVANEVCEYVHRELMSTWSQTEIRVELFAHAFEVNADAARGLDRSFLEAYYRNQFKEIKRIPSFYPLEMFLIDLGVEVAIVATLEYRFRFRAEDIARIMDRSLENVKADQTLVAKSLKSSPKVKLEEMPNLPAYDFLSVPEHHPTDISQILGDMKPKARRFRIDYRLVGLFILLGLIVGFVIYEVVANY